MGKGCRGLVRTVRLKNRGTEATRVGLGYQHPEIHAGVGTLHGLSGSTFGPVHSYMLDTISEQQRPLYMGMLGGTLSSAFVPARSGPVPVKKEARAPNGLGETRQRICPGL